MPPGGENCDRGRGQKCTRALYETPWFSLLHAAGGPSMKSEVEKTCGESAAEPAVVLTGRAAALWSEVRAGWSLPPPAEQLLLCACEALARAEEMAVVVSREGAVFRDRWGQVRPHPAALLERDHRGQAARHLQALGIALEE